jgi:uncharacterized membrane protein YGL010W
MSGSLDSFFARQLAVYASYHRDHRNRATHFIGIPAIVFSILVPLALLKVDGISIALMVAILAVLGWVALDRVIGLAMLIMMVPMLLIAEWVAGYGSSAAWIVFAIFFIGGWVFQLVGHVWEGRRPALADNLFQAFIGPMFIMAEVLMAVGLKQDLKAVVDGAPQAPA